MVMVVSVSGSDDVLVVVREGLLILVLLAGDAAVFPLVVFQRVPKASATSVVADQTHGAEEGDASRAEGGQQSLFPGVGESAT